MSLHFADPGAEYYFNRTLAQALAEGLWTDLTQVSFVNSAPAGRATTYAIFSSSGSGMFIGGATGSAATTLVVGWANYNSSSAFVNNVRIMAWTDGASQQCDLRTDATGHVFFTRNGTAIGGSSTNILSTGWHYYEVKTLFATGATGTCEFRVDGVVWLTIASVQTTTSGTARATKFFIRPLVENTNQYFKDIYCLDTGSGTLTNYLGDITVNVCYPAVAGPSQQWAPSAGTQLACVQDGITHTGTWPNDADYIFDSTSGHISDFTPQSVTVPGGGSIKAVTHVSRLSGDVGGANAQQYTKSGATAHTSSTLTLGSSAIYFFDIMENDPNTSAPWTQTGFNNSTHGVKVP